MTDRPQPVSVHWGPNMLRFNSIEDAKAFACELGCARALSYYPMWHTHAAL